MPFIKIFRTMKLYILRNYYHFKFFTILLFYFLYLNTLVGPFRRISTDVGYNINFGLFAFLLVDVRVKLVFFVGIALFFSNLPFKDPLNMSIISKLGKRGWYWSQVIYVFFSSIVINFFFFVIFVVSMVGYLSFENGWGTILRDLASQNSAIISHLDEQILPISELIISKYSPDKAILLTFTISVLVTIIIGLIILLGNRLLRNGGIILTYILIFINLFVPRALGRLVYFFSPITWISLTYVKTSDQSYLPSHSYIYGSAFLIIVLLVILIIVTINRKTEIGIERG